MKIDPQSKAELHRRAARPVLEDLAALGFNVHQIPELRRYGARYEPAVPKLVEHLVSSDHADVKVELAHVLAVPWAREHALRPLMKLFRDTPNSPPAPKAAIAAAIEVLADDTVERELTKLCTTQAHGNAREALVLAMARLDSPVAVDVLTELLADRGVGGHALLALHNLAQRTRIDLEKKLVKPFYNDGRAWVRRAARELAQALDMQK